MISLISMSFGLFWLTFLAATVLPFSSEPALSGALFAGLPPLSVLGIATFGNSLGSMTTYYLGRLGKLEWLEKYCRISAVQIGKVQARIGRFGAIAAFFCFLPVIGDIFAVALGFMRYTGWRFALFMVIGKFLRYALWIAIHIYTVEALS